MYSHKHTKRSMHKSKQLGRNIMPRRQRATPKGLSKSSSASTCTINTPETKVSGKGQGKVKKRRKGKGWTRKKKKLRKNGTPQSAPHKPLFPESPKCSLIEQKQHVKSLIARIVSIPVKDRRIPNTDNPNVLGYELKMRLAAVAPVLTETYLLGGRAIITLVPANSRYVPVWDITDDQDADLLCQVRIGLLKTRPVQDKRFIDRVSETTSLPAHISDLHNLVENMRIKNKESHAKAGITQTGANVVLANSESKKTNDGFKNTFDITLVANVNVPQKTPIRSMKSIDKSRNIPNNACACRSPQRNFQPKKCNENNNNKPKIAHIVTPVKRITTVLQTNRRPSTEHSHVSIIRLPPIGASSNICCRNTGKNY